MNKFPSGMLIVYLLVGVSCSTSKHTLPEYGVPLDFGAIKAFVNRMSERYRPNSYEYTSSQHRPDRKLYPSQDLDASDPQIGILSAKREKATWFLYTFDRQDSVIIFSDTLREGFNWLPIKMIPVPQGYYLIKCDTSLSQFWHP